jgi:hypothetical protein
MNILLFILDLLLFPITLIRLILIYFYGSRYGIKNLEFIDVMMHASNKYFNQLENDNNCIDTIDDDIRVKINYSSRYIKDNIPELVILANKNTKNIITDISQNNIIVNEPTDQSINMAEKNKLFDLLDHLTESKSNDEKIKSDINKLNSKLKKVDKLLEEGSD